MEKVIVDKDLCIGCGFCCATSEVFDMDDDDQAYTKEELNVLDSEDKKEEITDILEGCPTGAIKITEEE